MDNDRKKTGAMIYPEKLRRGDTIAIVSPATRVKEEYIRGAAEKLRGMGYGVRVMAGAAGPSDGSFASSKEQRLRDLRDALSAPEVKAILCARGGYGCVHLIGQLAPEEIRSHPKWLIGFSDVSALHALWHRAGVVSLHAPMAKHIATEPASDPCTRLLIGMLSENPRMDYEVAPHPCNRQGSGRGILRGGNLAVLSGLAGTPYDMLKADEGEDVILFIEDISEAVYAVERMLMRLNLAGVLRRIKGLIVGQFTEYGPDLNHGDMEEMADRLLTVCGISGIPVAFKFPVGHVALNYPLIEGAEVELTVGAGGVSLKSV